MSSTDVCVLTLQEAGRLEHYGHWPVCKHHRHIPRETALQGAEAGLLRFLGGEGTKVMGTVSMVVPVKITTWKPVQAHNDDGSIVIGLRTWGLQRS